MNISFCWSWQQKYLGCAENSVNRVLCKILSFRLLYICFLHLFCCVYSQVGGQFTNPSCGFVRDYVPPDRKAAKNSWPIYFGKAHWRRVIWACKGSNTYENSPGTPEFSMLSLLWLRVLLIATWSWRAWYIFLLDVTASRSKNHENHETAKTK